MEMNEKMQIKRVTPEIIRAQDEGMASIAERRPRNMQAVEQSVLAELKALGADEARLMFYAVPRAGKTIEGLSIRAADMVMRHYGNCQAAARIEDETEDFVDVGGVFHDLETNTKRYKALRVSKWFRRRDTHKLERMSLDMEVNAVNAGASKAVRNAILDGIPLAIKNKLFEAAKMVAIPPASLKDKDRPHPKALEQIQSDLTEAKITDEMIRAKYSKGIAEMTRAELTRVRGLLTAVEDGYTSLKEAFKPNDAEGPAGPEEVQVQAGLGATVVELPPREREPGAVEPEDPEGFEEEIDRGTAPAPAPALAAAPKAAPEVKAPEPADETGVVADMLASLDEVTTSEGYAEWPNRNARTIFSLSGGARERLLDNWKSLGRRKGFTRGKKK